MQQQPGPDSIHRTTEAVGDAWSWLVLREAILHNVTRFVEFHNRLGISRSTLSARLSQLVDGGLLVRSATGQRGTEYQLTASGWDFFDCLMTALAWGDRWYYPDATSPQAVIHLGCGRNARPGLHCGACHRPIDPSDVRPVNPQRRLGWDRQPGQRHRAPGYDLLERGRQCSIARTQVLIGDWWSGMLIREAFFGVHRFDEFRANLSAATNILSGRLARLVDHGILSHTGYQDRPVRYEYRLTEKGLDLYTVPLAMIMWGDRWKSPDGPLITLIHKPCGHQLVGELSCGSCAEPITRADVDIPDPTMSTRLSCA